MKVFSKELLMNSKVTLTVNVVPSDATCRLTYKGTYYYQNTLKVPIGSTVDYYIYKTGYETQSGSWTITKDTTKNIELSVQNLTLTVNTIPSDATCRLYYGGSWHTEKTAIVPYNTTVNYEVSRTGYTTQTGTWTITSDVVKSVSLSANNYTLTVNTTPSDATCVLTYNGSNYTTKSKSFPYGSVVSYTISKTGYNSQTGSWTIIEDTTKNISLTLKTHTLTVSTTPSDANCVLTYNGTNYTTKSLTVDYGSTVSYNVSKSGYKTETGSWTITSDVTKSVSLTEMVTLTVSPSPSDATVTLTASGYTQSGNTITVPAGTTVSYSVSKTGYVTQSGSWTINSTQTKTITLSGVQYTLTVKTQDSSGSAMSSSITINGTTYSNVSSKSVQFTQGATVSYSVYHSTYGTKSGSVTMNSNKTVTCKATVTSTDVSWTRSSLSSDGSMGGSSYAASASTVYGSNSAYKAFDGSSSSYWCSTNTGVPQTLTYYTPTAVRITSLSITTRSAGNYYVASATIQGSNNNSSWSTIGSYSNSTNDKGVSHSASITNSSSYFKYIRINMTARGGSGNFVTVGDCTFSGYYLTTSYSWTTSTT